MITQLSEEDVKTIAWDIGLVIDYDQIMLPSETKEGKAEAKIRDELDKAILQKALSERVFHYGKKRTKRVNWEKIGKIADGTDPLSAAIFLGAALTDIGLAIKKRFEVIDEVYVCELDGNVNYAKVKMNQLLMLERNLLKEINEKYQNKLHYLVSLKYYYEQAVNLQSMNPQKDAEYKKAIISFCTFIDDNINDFCNKIVNLSVKVSAADEKKYNILLITGKRIEVSKENLELNKNSLFLSYRTFINQLYFEMVEQARIPEIIDLTSDLPIQQPNQYEKHLHQLYEEVADKFELQQLSENAMNIRKTLKLL
jgi:hypothetical protein